MATVDEVVLKTASARCGSQFANEILMGLQLHRFHGFATSSGTRHLAQRAQPRRMLVHNLVIKNVTAECTWLLPERAVFFRMRFPFVPLQTFTATVLTLNDSFYALISNVCLHGVPEYNLRKSHEKRVTDWGFKFTAQHRPLDNPADNEVVCEGTVRTCGLSVQIGTGL
jgi:hypothetical protein